MGREIYGAFIRCGATTLVVFGLFDCFHMVAKVFNIDSGSRYSLVSEAYAAILFLGLGFIGLAGAHWIEGLAYGSRNFEA